MLEEKTNIDEEIQNNVCANAPRPQHPSAVLHERANANLKVIEKRLEADAETGKIYVTIPHTRSLLHLLDIRLRLNECSREIELVGVPGHNVLSDDVVNLLLSVCHLVGYFPKSSELVKHLEVIAGDISYNPIRETLNECEQEWLADKEERLESYLIDYAKIDDNDYTRFVSRAVMIAAALRVSSPGFQFKYVPVLEGPQDARKSSFLMALAMRPEFFTDALEIGSSAKETIEVTQGRLLIELSELSGKSRRDIDAIKAFVARTEDRARLSYARIASCVPRAFFLWGTTNNAKWLMDPTGDVRFWPLVVKATAESPIDLDGLKQIVRLLWGEAMHNARQILETQDFRELYPDSHIAKLAKVEQDRRYVGNDIHEVLSDYFSQDQMSALLKKHKTTGAFISSDFVRILLAYKLGEQFKVTGQAIAREMTQLGWREEKRRTYNSEQRQIRGYVYGDPPKGQLPENYVIHKPMPDSPICLASSIIE